MMASNLRSLGSHGHLLQVCLHDKDYLPKGQTFPAHKSIFSQNLQICTVPIIIVIHRHLGTVQIRLDKRTQKTMSLGFLSYSSSEFQTPSRLPDSIDKGRLLVAKKVNHTIT